MESAHSLPKQLGDFEILRELGRGGMGVVYEARQKSLNRRVALKVLSSGLGLTAKAVMRFRREAESAAKLHHTNIVPIYSTGEENGIHFYAMELVEGPSLDRVLRQLREEQASQHEGGGVASTADTPGRSPVPQWATQSIAPGVPTSPSSSGVAALGDTSTSSSNAERADNVARLVAEVADALEHAHNQGIIHRDIKPSNLLLSPEGRLVLNDFGLARVLEQPGMTISGELLGTPLYMSPEQISAGRAPLDHRTDIYSLGATLYELLSLNPPYPGLRRDEVVAQILYKDPKPPRRLNPKIPKDLETICLKAIEKDPDRRYPTADVMAADLRNYLHRYAISAKRTGPVGHAVKWIRRRPAIAILGIAVLVLVAVLGVFVYRGRAHDRESAIQLAEMYALAGEFELAETHTAQAESLGASDSWVKMLRGQLEVFRGNYDAGRNLLREARGDDEIRFKVQAMLVKSHFLAGDEGDYCEALESLKEEIPKSDDDFMWLGSAQSWAEPHLALESLNKVQGRTAKSALFRSIRGNVLRLCALDSVNVVQARKYIEQSIEDSLVAISMLEPNPYSAVQLMYSHLIAANCCPDQREYHLAKAQEAASEFPKWKDHCEVILAQYHFLQESGKGEEAIAYLCGIRDDLLNNYLRAFRGIARIRVAQYDLSVKDFLATDDDVRIFFAAFVALARLADSPDEPTRAAIRATLRDCIEKKKAKRAAYAMPKDWAALRLLGDDDGASKLGTFTSTRVREYKTPFMRDLAPLADFMETPADPARLIQQCKDSRRVLTAAYFALAMDALARGDRDEAKEHFQNCVDQKHFFFYAYQLSVAILNRMDNAPNWPEWIESSTDKTP